MSLARIIVVVAGIISQGPPVHAARIISRVPGDSTEVRTTRTPDNKIRFELCRLEKPIGCTAIGRKVGYTPEELGRRFEILNEKVWNQRITAAAIFLIGYFGLTGVGAMRGWKLVDASDLGPAAKAILGWNAVGLVAGGTGSVAYYQWHHEDRAHQKNLSDVLSAQERDDSVVTVDMQIPEFVRSLNYALMLAD